MKNNTSKVMSDANFLGFNWPPKMPGFKPKRKKQYRHDVLVVSKKEPDYAYVLNFSSGPKAEAFKKAADQALNIILVEYEKKEIPVTVEEGFIA